MNRDLFAKPKMVTDAAKAQKGLNWALEILIFVAVFFVSNIAMMIIWFVVAVCSMVLGLFTENWVAIRGTQWLGMLWLGVVIDAVAYLLWALALKGSENTAKIANLAYLTPFLSLVVSAVVLEEPIELRAFIALVFIIGGILLQSLVENRRK